MNETRPDECFMASSQPPPGQHSLKCMEIWGGNDAAQSAVSTPGLDVWVYSRPHHGAAQGGDVHYVSLCGGGVITRMIVADVSGHGESVAELSGVLRTLLRRNINRKNQARLVAALNQQFAAHARLGRFATAVVATYLADRDRLTVSNAGHPRPLWYRPESGQWSVLKPRDGRAGNDRALSPAGAANLPLGIDDDTRYDEVELNLGPGDLVIFYTDALSEATDAAGQMLGEAGLLAIARNLDVRNPVGLGPALLEAIARYHGGMPADDDATLLVLHHNAGPSPRLTIPQKLDVYAKVFGLRPF
jgi:serine phosphatase RsbU (regulator of sigma subunit)